MRLRGSRISAPRCLASSGARAVALVAVAALALFLVGRWLTTAHAARADGGSVQIKSLVVSLFPEYDEPRVLVTYQGELEGVSSFPTEVRLRVPRAADIREACAIQQPTDEHLCQLFNTEPAADDELVTYDTPLPRFFLEFYFGDIAAARDLDYWFRSDSPVKHLELVVQHPLRASDFTMSPPGSTVTEDSRGFLYHHFTYTDLTPAQGAEVHVTYHKADDKPSVVPKPIAISTAPRSDDRQEVILLGAGLLLTTALVVVIFALMDRFGAHPIVVVQSLRRGNHATKPVDPTAGRSSQDPVLCPRCSRPFPPGADLCPGCGTRANPNTTETDPNSARPADS